MKWEPKQVARNCHKFNLLVILWIFLLDWNTYQVFGFYLAWVWWQAPHPIPRDHPWADCGFIPLRPCCLHWRTPSLSSPLLLHDVMVLGTSSLSFPPRVGWDSLLFFCFVFIFYVLYVVRPLPPAEERQFYCRKNWEGIPNQSRQGLVP